MNKEQQELYDNLLKKVNEYCLGFAAEDVIESIDALVDNYETTLKECNQFKIKNSAPYDIFKKKGIYLAAFKAEHPKHNIVYQDINGKRDIGGDMMEVDLTPYDYIIATPPCNWWSRANYRRDRSPYALQTKHLLPDILKKLCEQNKPFIVENVKNKLRFGEAGLFDLPCHIYFVGRHTYWTNVIIDVSDIHQGYDFGHNANGNTILINHDGHREGGANVHEVIERFLEVIDK